MIGWRARGLMKPPLELLSTLAGAAGSARAVRAVAKLRVPRVALAQTCSSSRSALGPAGDCGWRLRCLKCGFAVLASCGFPKRRSPSTEAFSQAK